MRIRDIGRSGMREGYMVRKGSWPCGMWGKEGHIAARARDDVGVRSLGCPFGEGRERHSFGVMQAVFVLVGWEVSFIFA